MKLRECVTSGSDRVQEEDEPRLGHGGEGGGEWEKMVRGSKSGNKNKKGGRGKNYLKIKEFVRCFSVNGAQGNLTWMNLLYFWWTQHNN